MKSGRSSAKSWILPGLDVLIALLTLFVLLPIAGGLPGMASQGQPLIDGLWFTINLGGPMLLLAGGMNLLLRKVRLPLFVFFYAVLIASLGALRLQQTRFPLLVLGWLLMVVCVGGLLFSLRRPWLWAVAGTTWGVILLGIWSVGGVISFLSTETQQLSFYLPLQIVAFVFALVLLAVNLRRRESVADGV